MGGEPRIHAGVLSPVDLIELSSKGFYALSVLLRRTNLFSGVDSKVLINIFYLISTD